jgi:hypothetical protein
MSDLRSWAEEDATAEERSLLEVARRRRALPSQRAAVLSALGLGVTTGAASAAGIAGSLKLVGVALLASLGIGLAVVWPAHRRTPDASVATTAKPAVVPPGESALSNPAPSTAPSEPALPPAEASVKSVGKPRPPAVPSSSLSRELQVLKQAHEALARGNPNGALAALDDYHARFPQGALGAEETVIRVRALLARGDRARATAVAHQFSAAHPDSLYARRVELLVSDGH